VAKHRQAASAAQLIEELEFLRVQEAEHGFAAPATETIGRGRSYRKAAVQTSARIASL
jgi:hypothetical protein